MVIIEMTHRKCKSYRLWNQPRTKQGKIQGRTQEEWSMRNSKETRNHHTGGVNHKCQWDQISQKIVVLHPESILRMIIKKK